MKDRRKFAWRNGAAGVALLAITIVTSAQTSQTKTSTSAKVKRGTASQKISLSPRFVPGQTFRYQMEVETTTDTSRSGIASDPQGPSSLVINWSATVRIDLLAVDTGAASGIRLRTTYEKSAATVRSDTFDPAATETAAQYHKLEGKVVEFLLDPGGKVESVAGLEEISDSEKAAQSAREWVAQLSAGTGAPSGGVSVGQMWSTEQPATTLPIAGMIWRTDSQYLRNESCHPPNPDLPSAIGAAASAPDSPPALDCAVILAKLSLVRSKASHDETPPELRQNGVESSGKWSGSGESLLYVSLASGLVVSATQTGTEEMDVTLTTNHNNTSMRYAGTISSRSHVALVQDRAGGN